jgi:hypothetical protein
MGQFKAVVMLLVGVVVGCAAERVIVPPASARASPQRWEYACRTKWGDDDISRMATELGQQGWELAGAAGTAGMTTWCFKRSVP